MSRVLFYKNLAWQLLLQGARYFFPLLLVPYLTRILKPDGFAVYAYIVAFGGFVQVFIEYGFNLAGTRYIAHAKSLQDKERASGDVFYSRLFLSCLSLAATLFISSYIAVFRENLVFLLAVVSASAVKASMPDFIFQGYERLGALTNRFIFTKSLAIFPVFFFVHSVNDIYWIPLFDLASSVVGLFWSYFLVRRFFHLGFRFSGPKRIIFLLRRNFPYFISNISAASLNGLTTLVIGVSSLNFIEVSYWSIALTVVCAVQSLFSPLLNSLYPHIVIHNDIAFVKKIIKFATPVIFIGCVAFVFSSRTIVCIVAGDAYLEGVWVMQWLSALIFIPFFSMILGWPLLGARGYAKEIAITTVTSSCLCIAMLLVAICFFGLTMERLCFIRCFSELLLAFMRFFYCQKFRLLQ